MDYSMGGVGGSDDSNTRNRSPYQRLSSSQTTILEEFMKKNQYLDEAQQNQLAKEVGLEPREILYWFQNNRYKLKIDQTFVGKNAFSKPSGAELSPTLAIDHDMEKVKISQIAAAAMEELVRLVRLDEPLWIKSYNEGEVRQTLCHENYEQAFPKKQYFNGANVVRESSKYSTRVSMSGKNLVDMFMDSVGWTKLFPTIVSKSETIKVFESGALQLVCEQMHILSPLVQPREFNIIRYCRQVDVGVWVITNVSYDSSQPETTHIARSWKHPSGCMIRETFKNFCEVTWVEHVEVDDMNHTHYLYRHLVGTYNLYGAKSWIRALERMSAKTNSFYVQSIPEHESRGVIQTLEGRKSVMKLSHRMVKMFCQCLAMSSKLDFPNLIQDSIGGIMISIEKNTSEGKPTGMVVAGVATLWIPLSDERVFKFLIDPTQRFKWDMFFNQSPVTEIARISYGLHSGNTTSIIKPLIPRNEKNAVILQESFTSPVGSYIIYAPIDVKSMNVAIKGEDSTKIHILPLGFVVSSTERLISENSRAGSLLTLACQTLASSQDGTMMTTVEAVANLNNLLSNILVKVKDELRKSNYSN